MFGLKNSHSVITLILLFSVCFYGQNNNASQEIDQKNNSLIKPQTIQLNSKSKISEAVASDNEKEIYITVEEGLLYSYDITTFEQIWMTDLGGVTTSNILEFGDRIFVITTNVVDSAALNKISTLWEIDKISGVTIRRTNASGQNNFHLFKTDKDVIIVSDNSCISVLNPKLEKTSEKYCENRELTYRPLFDSKKFDLFLISKNNIVKITMTDEITSEKVWKQENPITSFVFSDKVYYIGDEKGNVFAVERNTLDKIWGFRAGGKISGLELSDGKVLLSSYDNFVYCLREEDGNRIWKKRFPGRVLNIDKRSENNLFVKSSYSNDIYNVDIPNGDIKDKYIVSEYVGGKINITTTSRLIITRNSFSIDFYSKN